jgi:hypothetical protein
LHSFQKNRLAIFVTYFPDLVALKKQLDVLLPQVGVVMNGSAYEYSVWNTDKVL